MAEEEVKPNEKVKDSLFTDLFESESQNCSDMAKIGVQNSKKGIITPDAEHLPFGQVLDPRHE